MSDPKRILFIDRLAKRTAEGEIEWEQTSEEGVFQATFTNYTVQISEEPSKTFSKDYGISDIHIQINDENGAKVETIIDEEFGDLTTADGEQVSRVMFGLYADVRRRAMGIDRAVDFLLDQLSRPEDDLPF